MADYTLSAKITGDSTGFEKAFSTAQKTVDSFEAKMAATSSKLQSLGSNLMSAGTKASLAITTPVVLAGKKMVNAASDYKENLNKIDVAFENSADTVKEWSNNATKQFGLSKNQALEATSLYGDMATSMGLTRAEAAEMSMSLAGLGGDLASFKNIGVDRAMTALNGVFTGETESLKTLGIVMTDTNLNAYALEKGIGKTTDQMSQAEKVQLRYAYVMDMTANAQGDYARTSDGTANSLRTFQGAVDNLNIALGQHLLPILTPLVQKATELIDKFAEADPKTQQLVLKIAALAAVIGPVLIVSGTLINSVGSIIGAFGKASGVISGAGKVIGWLTSPIGLTMIAILALLAIGYLLISNWETIKAVGTDVWNDIQGLFQMFDDYLTGIFTTDWTESFGIYGNILNAFFATVSDIWDSVKRIFSGIISFVTGIFTGNWSQAWQGVVDIFGGIWDGLEAVAKAPLNGLIGLVNAAIGGLNSISVTIPKWVPKYGGRSFGIDIPTVPYLYHGTDNWQGGFAYINEGGRGELTHLPDGTQVIPHDISEKYAKESARMNRSVEPVDFSRILEGVTILVDASTSVDGTPLKELAAEYTIRKIGIQQRAILRAKGAYA